MEFFFSDDFCLGDDFKVDCCDDWEDDEFVDFEVYEDDGEEGGGDEFWDEVLVWSFGWR